MNWHVVTGEYPPQPGGVSAYTRQVARGLAAAGDCVTVWAPRTDAPDTRDDGVDVRRLPDVFGLRSLRLLDAELGRDASPHRMLVQYVPHAFGWKGANLPFCRWMASRAGCGIWVMFHEVGFPFDAQQSLLRNALAAANRVMARLVVRSAERVFVSIPGWQPILEPLTSRETAMTWLPVPSGIAVSHDAARVDAVRARVGDGHPIVGHFGTYAPSIRVQLADAIPRLMAASDARVLLIGPRGAALREEVIAREPSLSPRIVATGALQEVEVSAHLAACDVMMQPYPDGVSSRRTSAMAALAHGVAVVATDGWLTEPIWRASDAAALVPADDPALLADETVRLLHARDARTALAAAGQRLYDGRFDLRHTIDALRGTAAAPAPSRVCA
jgi:glycosyltransferase involved in cell wall biosynthesis